MNNALAIAAKEFRHMLHDRFTLVLMLIVPLFQLVVYGYAFDLRFRNLPGALVNLDPHPAGRALAGRIAASPLFVIDPTLRTEAQIEAALRRGTIRIAMLIPPGFTAGLLSGEDAPLRVWVDGGDLATSNYLLAALDALGSQATIERLRPASEELRPAQARYAPEIRIDERILFNPSGRSAAFLLPGLIAILVQMITMLLMALSIAGERERGTLEQLLVTRMKPFDIIAGKALAVTLIGLAECAALMLLMKSLFDVPIEGSVAFFLAIIPLLVLAPLAIGLLIAARARNLIHALQLSQIVLLPSILLSGFLLPREFLNPPLSSISDLLPTTYLVTLVRGIHRSLTDT
jgi:ABC-2 type transport system permease protein